MTKRRPTISRGKPNRRRAFALPLVILLTLIVSLAVAILMQRNSIGYLAARRQADGYIDHHAGLGMREMVSRWLTTVRGRLNESLEDDGFAFSLELPGGDRVDVFLDDAQGAALARTDMLTGRRREIVEMMNAYLDLMESEGVLDEAQRTALDKGLKNKDSFAMRQRTHGKAGEPIEELPMRRMYGPSEVSIKSASREVLEALASAITEPKKAIKVADALVQRREDQTGTRELAVDEVTRTLRELGIEDEEMHEISSMLVYAPTLFRVTAEVRGSGGQLLEKAVGLMEVQEGRNDPFNQNGPFLTWEAVPIEEDEFSGR
jgi:hypothetical protein